MGKGTLTYIDGQSNERHVKRISQSREDNTIFKEVSERCSFHRTSFCYHKMSTTFHEYEVSQFYCKLLMLIKFYSLHELS